MTLSFNQLVKNPVPQHLFILRNKYAIAAFPLLEVHPVKRNGDQVELNTEEASGGTRPNIVRYVLAISLLLAILGLSAVWITGAVTSGS